MRCTARSSAVHHRAPPLYAALPRNPTHRHPLPSEPGTTTHGSGDMPRCARRSSELDRLVAPATGGLGEAPQTSGWQKWPVERQEPCAAKSSDQLPGTRAGRLVHRRTDRRLGVVRRRSERATIPDTRPLGHGNDPAATRCARDTSAATASLVRWPRSEACRCESTCRNSLSGGYCGRQRRCTAMLAWQRSLPAALELAGRQRRPVLAYVWKDG